MSKHIDTLDVQLALRPSAKKLIKSKLYPSSTEAGVYELSPEYLPVAFKYRCRGYYLIVKLSHKFMVGIETAKKLQEKVIPVVIDFFHISTDDIVKYKVVKTPTSKIRVRCNSGKYITRKIGGNKIHQDLVEINRIEYKNDYKLKVYDEQLAAQDIFRIASDTVKGADKGQYKYPNRTNCIYSSERNNHVSITSYFKEYARLENGDIEGAERYKGILRTEVKVKNRHLDYKKDVRDKTLANYFKEEVAKEYFTGYIEPVFYTEDYYRLNVAIDKIQNADNLKTKNGKLATQLDKDRACAFITEINQFGISSVVAKYSDKTFKKYIGIIRSLGINPLCYSPVIDGKEITIKKMDNFTLFINGIDTDI